MTIDHSGKVSALQQISVFREMDGETIEKIAGLSEVLELEANSPVYLAGEAAEHIYVLISGVARMWKKDLFGRSVEIRKLKAGELCGLAGLMEQESVYPLTVETTDRCVWLRLPTSSFKGTLKRAPLMRLNVHEILGEVVKRISDGYVESDEDNAEVRIARGMVKCVLKNGRKVGKAHELELKLTQQNLVEAADTNMFTVSRVLALWQRKGFVRAGRGRIIVLQPEQILRIAEGDRQQPML